MIGWNSTLVAHVSFKGIHCIMNAFPQQELCFCPVWKCVWNRCLNVDLLERERVTLMHTSEIICGKVRLRDGDDVGRP